MHGHDDVHLRLLEPDESHLVQDVFDQMSSDSRFLRFHAATPRLSAAALRHLSSVEPGRHTVVVALLQGRAIGLARWIRMRHDAETAELAVDVADDHQGGGVGRALVAAAATSAAQHGITHFLVTVHPENRLVQSVLRRVGARPRKGRPGDLYLPVASLAQREVVVPWPRAVRRTGSAAGVPRRP